MPQKIMKTFLKNPDLIGRIVLVLAVIGVFVIAIMLSGPKPVEYSSTGEEFTPSPISTLVNEPQTSKLVTEGSESSVTRGVIVGVAAVLLLVELGTLFEIWYQKNHTEN